MTSYHVNVLYSTSIGIGCPNIGEQLGNALINYTAAILTQYTVLCFYKRNFTIINLPALGGKGVSKLVEIYYKATRN